jgi:flavin-dependent dehydrogenase
MASVPGVPRSYRCRLNSRRVFLGDRGRASSECRGDAALVFDPLSSQGLLNFLFTGLAAAEAMARSLDGARNALPGHVDTLAGIREAYAAHVKRRYAEEQRWPDRPFWRRRHARDHPDADDPSPPSRVRSLQEQLVSVGQHVMIRLPRSGPEGYSSGAP